MTLNSSNSKVNSLLSSCQQLQRAWSLNKGYCNKKKKKKYVVALVLKCRNTEHV